MRGMRRGEMRRREIRRTAIVIIAGNRYIREYYDNSYSDYPLQKKDNKEYYVKDGNEITI